MFLKLVSFEMPEYAIFISVWCYARLWASALVDTKCRTSREAVS